MRYYDSMRGETEHYENGAEKRSNDDEQHRIEDEHEN